MFDLVGIRLTGSRPVFPLGFITPYCWGEWSLCVFFKDPTWSEASHCKCFHRNSALCLCHCGGGAQNPQGGGVTIPVENATGLSIPQCEFSSGFWDHCGVLNPRLYMRTDNERSYWLSGGWHLERWLHVSRSVNINGTWGTEAWGLCVVTLNPARDP